MTSGNEGMGGSLVTRPGSRRRIGHVPEWRRQRVRVHHGASLTRIAFPMISSPDPFARGVARLEHALAVSALLPAERAVLLALLRMLGAADAALREPAGIDPTAHAAGVLIALLDTYHHEIGRLGQ